MKIATPLSNSKAVNADATAKRIPSVTAMEWSCHSVSAKTKNTPKLVEIKPGSHATANNTIGEAHGVPLPAPIIMDIKRMVFRSLPFFEICLPFASNLRRPKMFAAIPSAINRASHAMFEFNNHVVAAPTLRRAIRSEYETWRNRHTASQLFVGKRLLADDCALWLTDSVVIGDNNTLTVDNCVVIGNRNTIRGSNNCVRGLHNTVTGSRNNSESVDVDTTTSASSRPDAKSSLSRASRGRNDIIVFSFGAPPTDDDFADDDDNQTTFAVGSAAGIFAAATGATIRHIKDDETEVDDDDDNDKSEAAKPATVPPKKSATPKKKTTTRSAAAAPKKTKATEAAPKKRAKSSDAAASSSAKKPKSRGRKRGGDDD